MLSNDPAFPLNSGDGGINIGLSNRDLAAMFAMQGILASGKYANLEYVAKKSYEAADALIERSEQAAKPSPNTKVSVRPIKRTRARFGSDDAD